MDRPPVFSEPPLPPLDGQTESGVPFAQRGRVALLTGAFLSTGTANPDGTTSQNRGASFDILASIPVADRVFIDAVLPFSVLTPFGNPTVGASYVGKLGKRIWLTGGGSVGIPLLGGRGSDVGSAAEAVPRAYWNMHEYVADVVPIQARALFEWHSEYTELRVHAEPSLWAPIGRNKDVHGAFYHSAEIQVGHRVGGGVRLQGVVVGPGSDHYQFAVSPFFALSRAFGALRLGLMMPADKPLGPPFKNTWGFLADVALHID